MADSDDDTVLLWYQAHERLANLERLDADFTGAETRLVSVGPGRRSIWGNEPPVASQPVHILLECPTGRCKGGSSAHTISIGRSADTTALALATSAERHHETVADDLKRPQHP
jgi:hypothetical protein